MDEELRQAQITIQELNNGMLDKEKEYNEIFDAAYEWQQKAQNQLKLNLELQKEVNDWKARAQAK